METKSLSWSRILGYGLGDVANNFAFAMGALFLLNYYTDVAGITAAAAGTMLLLVRIFDAVMDIVAGRVVDSTRTRWGRFRPFLLWGAVPLMVSSVLVFSVPHDWSTSNKLIWAYVTYAALGLAYSFVNIPYGSLATVMSQDGRDRARLGAARAFMAASTFAFLAFVLGPRIRGAAGAQEVFTQTTIALAVAGVVLYLVCFGLTREVVTRTVERPPLKESISTLFRNGPLMYLCFCALLMLTATFSVNASTVYFARYVLGGMDWFATIVVVNLLFGTAVAAVLVPLLVARVGKRSTFVVGAFTAAVGYAVLFMVPVGQTALALAVLAVAAVGNMTTMTVVWALEADTVEYGEWRTGLRIEGLTYSFFSFTRKTGQAIGGSVPAYLLAMSDYVPNAATQSDAARFSILAAFALVPCVTFALAGLLMLRYPLTEARFTTMLEEIRARRT